VNVYVITGFVDGKKVVLKVTDSIKISLDLVKKYSDYGNLVDVKSEVCDFLTD
jgi:hypothetical protein